MPSEKGKSRGRKRKGMVEASEGTEESQDSPLTQGKGEKYVPRFSTKRTRNTRAKAKPCTPAEKLQLAENAATDQSGEVWRNSECKHNPSAWVMIINLCCTFNKLVSTPSSNVPTFTVFCDRPSFLKVPHRPQHIYHSTCN